MKCRDKPPSEFCSSRTNFLEGRARESKKLHQRPASLIHL